MTESYPETAASPTPAAPTLATALVTDPAAEARPDHAKSRSNRRNALMSGVNYLGRSATIILAGWPRCSLGAESPVFWCGRGCPWWGRRWGSCRGFADTRGGDSDPPAPAHPEGVSGWASPLWSRETGAVVVTDAGIVVVVGVMAVGVRTTTWPRASLRR